MSDTLCPHEWAMADGVCHCTLCGGHPTLWVLRGDGTPDVLYTAQPHQVAYHESSLPNCIMVGPRGTGKSLTLRMDAHLRAMAVPGFRYLVIRRTMPELKRSHLVDVGDEMRRLGGTFHIGDSIAYYPNGSIGWYGHCDTPADMMKYLSAQYDLVAPDELTTFTAEILVKMASCVRVPKGSGRIGMFKGGTNKLGIGAEHVRKYFFDKDVEPQEDPDYNPDDWGVIAHKWGDNLYIDIDQYKKRMSSLPEHVRKAWLEDEWVIEGAYFPNFRPFKNGEPWHVIIDMPTVRNSAGMPVSFIGQQWINIYRAIDWGFDPDPAVCLWIAMLPNKRAIVFKERQWKRTLAKDVAQDIKRNSEGMHIVETFADPGMLLADGKGAFGIGDLFEANGVPLTPCVNKRDAYGYAIHDYLNTEIDGLPRLQILAANGPYGAPNLIKTIPQMAIAMPPKDPNLIADGNDHWVVALAYFCMGMAVPSKDPITKSTMPRWRMPKRRPTYAFN